MRLLIVNLLTVLFSAYCYADTLSDADLLGRWQAELSSVHKDSMLGQVKWIQITFLKDNGVEWTFEREGKIEEHKGKYVLSAAPVKEGVQKTTDIALYPQTMAVYRSIPLQKVVIDHDSRFPLSEKVLKCKDHGGNDLVFSRPLPSSPPKPNK